MSVVCHDARREAFAKASRFRGEFYECLTARRDELFELTDALLCVEGAGHLTGGADAGTRAPPWVTAPCTEG